MPVRKTLTFSEPVLRETAIPVENVLDPHIQAIITDCVDTMHSEELAGFAAPQLGESVRIFVSEIRKTKYRNPTETAPLTIYVNPEITWRGEETILDYEGCGSIPDTFGSVERASEIKITYLDEAGERCETKANGLLARVIQHEIDHLNGILFIDLADPASLISKAKYLAKKK